MSETGESQLSMEVREERSPLSHFITFLALVLLAGFAVPLIAVPEQWVEAGKALSSALFISLPIFAIFFGSALPWRRSAVVAALVLGVAAAVLLAMTDRWVAPGPAVGALVSALSQVAVLIWAGALGVLIATFIRDRNLLLPMAAVLATTDIIAVLTPVGPVKRALESDQGRAAFEMFAYTVPQFGQAKAVGILPVAFVGPADFLFLAMFFAVIHRFGMRARETLVWVVPALAVYLGIVLFFGDAEVLGVPLRALPALVPIGLVVLAVNWREFRMSPQEKLMTGAVVLVCVLAVVAAFALGAPKRDETGQPPERAGPGSAAIGAHEGRAKMWATTDVLWWKKR
ncbi:MAG: hypothetical protein IH851_06340 [Armatimonadetes bacterium]|nr:hypothetical protein [Armatimonadota bacterium]